VRFDEVIDLSAGKLAEGVRRIAEGYSDIVIDAIGGDVLSEALVRRTGSILVPGQRLRWRI
jgi:hypothetical protein